MEISTQARLIIYMHFSLQRIVMKSTCSNVVHDSFALKDNAKLVDTQNAIDPQIVHVWSCNVLIIISLQIILQ